MSQTSNLKTFKSEQRNAFLSSSFVKAKFCIFWIGAFLVKLKLFMYGTNIYSDCYPCELLQHWEKATWWLSKFNLSLTDCFPRLNYSSLETGRDELLFSLVELVK